jgi:hypothetical protein
VEHTADQACARVLPDDCPGEPVPAAEGRARHRSGARPQESSAWDASVGVRPDGAADAAHRVRLALADADAGKLAGQEQGGRVQDAFPWAILRLEPQAGVAELYKQDAVQSAEQSCAAQEAAERPELEVLRASEKQRERQAEPMLQLAGSQEQMEPKA